MTEGYLKLWMPDAMIFSAGVEVHGLNPLAVQVMAEDGVDISTHLSKSIDDLPLLSWDVVITVCDNAREQCPVLPGHHLNLHHGFEDPAKATGTADEVRSVYRNVRDAIRTYVRELVETNILTLKNT